MGRRGVTATATARSGSRSSTRAAADLLVERCAPYSRGGRSPERAISRRARGGMNLEQVQGTSAPRDLASVAMVALLLAVPGVRAANTGTAQTYLVVFKAQALPANAAASITAAGGTVVQSYPKIGVVIARSSSSTFRSSVMRNGAIRGAAATAAFATHVSGGVGNQSRATSSGVNTPVSDSDPLSPLQWDMRQIHTPEAHAITGGSSSVVV